METNSGNDEPTKNEIFNNLPEWWNGKIPFQIAIVYILCNAKIFLKFFGLMVYIFDVVTDYLLVLRYIIFDGDYVYGIMTFQCILISSLFISYWSYRRKRHVKLKGCKNIVLCFFIIIFSLEPIFCSAQYLSYRIRCEEAKKLKNEEQGKRIKNEFKEMYKHRQTLYPSKNLAYLKLFEACLEAVPQLMLQVYIMYNGSTLDTFTLYFQIASMSFSFLGIIYSLFQWMRVRLSSHDKNISMKGLLIWLLGQIAFLVFRIGAIIVAISVSNAIAFNVVILLIIHWLATSFLDYYGIREKQDTIIDCALFGFINIFLLIYDNVNHRIIVFITVILQNLSFWYAVKEIYISPSKMLLVVFLIIPFFVSVLCVFFFTIFENQLITDKTPEYEIENERLLHINLEDQEVNERTTAEDVISS